MFDPAPTQTDATIVFDLDGTLAETAPDLIAALNFVLTSEGIEPLPLASARYLLGAGGRALISRGFAQAGRALDAPKLEILFDRFLGYYNDHIADHSTLFPGVIESLDRFAAAGWRLAVCTNKIEASSHLLLGKLGVAGRFAFICGQDTFGVGKPDPKPLLETIRKVGGRPERTIMVGDSRTDIETARAAGTPVVAVDFGYTDKPVAELGPDRVISHFDALFAEAEALVA
ncbi:MAG: phosphoglycolate phosphatase, partial [Hyphomicrobiales bacterium]|nr:phosphoglycolate phosphatase [Hyphomicrobiales bacterium]